MSSDQRDYYAAKYQKIEDLPGIGPATANKLRELGYKTVQALATAPLRELTSGGIGEDTAYKIVEAARKSMALQFITAEELLEFRKDVKQMTTGIPNLDNMLDGGLETRSITEFYGEFGSGKSQMCQQLAVTVQLPVEQGGLGGSCLYIDTEQVFRPERIVQIANRFELDPNETLRKIIFAEAYTSEHQMMLLESSDELIKEHSVRCIIVDSLTGHFRSEYPGRELLPPRQQALNKHMHKLIRLARVFDAAAIVTNQVQSTPDAYMPRAQILPVGGHVVGHIAHTRIFLRKGRNSVRIAKILASPFLAEGLETPMRISSKGIVGDEVE